jgi:hypothetical protein
MGMRRSTMEREREEQGISINGTTGNMYDGLYFPCGLRLSFSGYWPRFLALIFQLT